MKYIMLPNGFEDQSLKALSYYPNLKKEHICFIERDKKLPYAARPSIWHLINPFLKRKYYIIISDNSGDVREPTLLKNLSYKSQIGVLGHELAHIHYYSQTPAWRIILDGICYMYFPFRSRFEKMTDRIVIDHGLGEYLLCWCIEVYPIKKNDGKRAETYYKPNEIKALLENKT